MHVSPKTKVNNGLVKTSAHRRPCKLQKLAAHSSRLHGASASAANHSSEDAILIEGLSHRFGDREVLRAANLRIRRGSLHVLAGPNGCGKSTLLRILGDLVPKQRGQVIVDGPIGMVLQNPDHQIVMPTVAAEVAFGLGRFQLSNQTVRRLVKSALEAVDLGGYEDRPTNTLSGGEKQRVAIAGALVTSPKVLLLDELTTFLDDEGQRSVMRAVRNAVDGVNKVTALWVTHRLEELKWADAASFMEDGQVKLTGTPDKVFHHFWQLGAHL